MQIKRYTHTHKTSHSSLFPIHGHGVICSVSSSAHHCFVPHSVHPSIHPHLTFYILQYIGSICSQLFRHVIRHVHCICLYVCTWGMYGDTKENILQSLHPRIHAYDTERGIRYRNIPSFFRSCCCILGVCFDFSFLCLPFSFPLLSSLEIHNQNLPSYETSLPPSSLLPSPLLPCILPNFKVQAHPSNFQTRRGFPCNISLCFSSQVLSCVVFAAVLLGLLRYDVYYIVEKIPKKIPSRIVWWA